MSDCTNCKYAYTGKDAELKPVTVCLIAHQIDEPNCPDWLKDRATPKDVAITASKFATLLFGKREDK